jgi:hypothetical protein
MKKLISIFAALALVGSLAAQKKKAPAKPAAPAAPAAPAVKAPAAPVVAAPAMPSAEMAGKGMGLFVEGFGSFTFGNGTSDTVENGSPATIAGDTERKNASQNTSGFGGGASIGYDIAENLALVAGFNYRSLAGRKYENSYAAGNITRQTTFDNMGLTLGLRPSVKAFGGVVYAGGGWLVTLPYTQTTEFTNTSNTATFTAGDSFKLEDKWNIGLKGMYGEIGYQYNISSSLYVGIGAKLFVATVDNIGKTRTQTVVASGTTVTTTTTYQEAASANAIAAADDADTTTVKSVLSRDWKTNGITDFAVNVAVGYRL